MFVALLLLAAGFSSRPDSPFPDQPGEELQGLYLAAGGGGSLILAGSNSGAYDGELRLGYSVNPGLAIYLSGAIDGGNIYNRDFRSLQAVVFLQYHLYAAPRSPVMVYARAGIGVAFGMPLPDLAQDTTGVGLAEAGG